MTCNLQLIEKELSLNPLRISGCVVENTVTHRVTVLFGNSYIAAVWHLYIVRKGKTRQRRRQKCNITRHVFHFVNSEGTGHLSSHRSLPLPHIFYEDSIFKQFGTHQTMLTRLILLAHSCDLLTNKTNFPQHLLSLGRIFKGNKN